jgi:hypothetical protein
MQTTSLILTRGYDDPHLSFENGQPTIWVGHTYKSLRIAVWTRFFQSLGIVAHEPRTKRPTLGTPMRRIMAATCERLDDQEARALAEDFKVAFKVPFKLRARTSSLQRLVDVLQRAHGFEREAFGIADDDAGTPPLDTMTTAELEAEIARLDGERAAQA